MIVPRLTPKRLITKDTKQRTRRRSRSSEKRHRKRRRTRDETRSHLGYDEVKVIRYSSITESLVNECLCSLGGWVALVPVEVIASAPEVELDLLEGEEGKPPVE